MSRGLSFAVMSLSVGSNGAVSNFKYKREVLDLTLCARIDTVCVCVCVVLIVLLSLCD